MAKKLQVFISSTYIDMVEERQAAVQAILRAGHIPAGMELFAANDEGQMAVIKRWIEESDVFMLLLGRRYGTVEKHTGKSYTHLEFEYAMELHKPFFCLITSDEYIGEKIRLGAKREELIESSTAGYREFRSSVESNMCRFVASREQIAVEVNYSLNALQQEHEFGGWVKAEEAHLDSRELWESLKYTADIPRSLNVGIEGCEWITPLHLRQKWVLNQLERVETEVRLVCYSLEGWEDSMEETLTTFLGNHGRLRVLLLDPDERGFQAKTAAEAFGYFLNGLQMAPDGERGSFGTRLERLRSLTAAVPNQDSYLRGEWEKTVSDVRRTHRAAIAASQHTMEIWQRRYGHSNISWRYYHDLPNFHGWLFDHRAMYASSFIFNPTQRGFALPALCISDVTCTKWTEALHAAFVNWFEISFAAGRAN